MLGFLLRLTGDPQDVLQHMVSSYLVHHGYCVTAQAFAKDTHQAFDEEITSIINRQSKLDQIHKQPNLSLRLSFYQVCITK
jgi:LisH.